MAGHTYKIIDLVGTSEEGVSQAVEAAIARANQSLRNLDWFEVGQIRGRVENGKVAEYQVNVKVGFRVLSDEDVKAEA